MAVLVAVLLLGVGGVVVAITSRGDGGSASPAGDEPAQFAPVDSLCQETDFSPVLAFYPFTPADLEERAGDSSPPDSISCIFDRSTPLHAQDPSPLAALEVHAFFHDSAEVARAGYDGTMEQAAGLRDRPDLFDGWDAGATLLEATGGGTRARVVAIDGVLMLQLILSMSSWGELPDLDDQQAALVAVAESIRQVLRQV
jgi:hypothetical protein